MQSKDQSLRPKASCLNLGWLFVLVALVLCGCASSRSRSFANDRSFVFQQDSFAYANELVWEYHRSPVTGQTRHSRRQPAPTYTHHCFVVVRAARQFFQHARFDPHQPVASETTYRNLIQRVTSTSPRTRLADDEKILIPGYPSLYAFSQAQANMLKAECGGACQSYCQRGHWRMILPLGRSHQERMAWQLVESLKQNRPSVVHLVRFPTLAINHAVLLFDVHVTTLEIHFSAYDPNCPEMPTVLTYDRAQRRFRFPANHYFAGGRVDVYEIYHTWNY